MRPSSPTGPTGRRSIHSTSVSPSRKAQSRDRSDKNEVSSDNDCDCDNPSMEELPEQYLEESLFHTTHTEHSASNSQKTASTQSPKPVRQKFAKKIEDLTLESARPADNHSTQSSLNYVYLGGLFVVGLVLAYFIAEYSNANTLMSIEYKNCLEFEKLKKTFRKQDPYLWRALRTGIEGVLNNEPAKPSIFLILHQNGKTTEQLTSNIVKGAANCFGSNSVTLSSDDFTSEDVLQDWGVVVERYKNALEKGGVLFIADLNKIPANSAQALHFICDNENPPVHKAVIFLTLESSTNFGNVVERAEETLNTMWSAELNKDILDPLIIRVTDQVLELVPE